MKLNFENNRKHWLFFSDVTRPGLFVYNVSNAHNSVINGVDVIASSGSSEIVTGGKDGLIKVWDPRQHNRPTIEIRPAKVRQTISNYLNYFNSRFFFQIFLAYVWRLLERIVRQFIQL